MHGRVSLPVPTPEAIRSAKALMREAGASYSPVLALLKVVLRPQSQSAIPSVEWLCLGFHAAGLLGFWAFLGFRVS